MPPDPQTPAPTPPATAATPAPTPPTTPTPGPAEPPAPKGPGESSKGEGGSTPPAPAKPAEPAAPKEGEPPTPPKEGEKKDDKTSATLVNVKDLKVPEGVTLDEETATRLASIVTDEKLSPQERTQRIVDEGSKALQAAVNGPIEYWKETQVGWRRELAEDPEVGSKDINAPVKKEVVTGIAKVVDAIGGDELRRALFYTGAGNHPAIVRAFAKLVPYFAEGRTVSGGPPSGTPKSVADALYGHLRK